MTPFQEAFRAVAQSSWSNEWKDPRIVDYVVNGEESVLATLPKFESSASLPFRFQTTLGLPDKLTDEGRRFLKLCQEKEHPIALGKWLFFVAENDGLNPPAFAAGCEVVKEMGCTGVEFGVQLARGFPKLGLADGKCTLGGIAILKMTDRDLGELYRRVSADWEVASRMVELFVERDLPRWKSLLTSWHETAQTFRFPVCTWELPLRRAPKEFLELSKAAVVRFDTADARFRLGSALWDAGAIEEGRRAVERALQIEVDQDAAGVSEVWYAAQQMALWLIEKGDEARRAVLCAYLATALPKNEWRSKGQSEYKIEVLDALSNALGKGCIPMLDACFQTPQGKVQLRAIQQWMELGETEDRARWIGHLGTLLGDSDNAVVARALRMASEGAVRALESEVWKLLEHKSTPVREAAAAALARLGDARLGKAEGLWGARKVPVRLACVSWLRALGSEGAAAALKRRLDVELDDTVRDAILLALEQMPGGGVALDAAGLRERIAKTLAKSRELPVTWLKLDSLPHGRRRGGEVLDSDTLIYLLQRQSRVKEIRADIEAKPLYAALDRAACGDLALAVLKAYFGSKIEADDRWAMAFAALVGDDRLVPVFTSQIQKWADDMRGKLAEYAVQSLALLGTDAALLAVDAMAIRYRTKNKNIGKMATEAFADAAAARGLTVEELGDLVVPWLGFEPGKPRVIDAGKQSLEVRITSDFKLAFRDVTTGKKVAKLPDSAPEALKAEFKDIAVGMKEAVKSQLLRMETLMVRQFRWPESRWRELFLRHPLLMPFAQRLVWAAYDEAGNKLGTFRALEDGSLTDVEDEPYQVPPGCWVGILHPLELEPEARQRWCQHAMDYDLEPPFAQLERPVVAVKAEQVLAVFWNDVKGIELNGMTFKGRAERLGWSRGSVCDAGAIQYYLKRFPSAGVDVFVEVEGMFVGIDMESEITLGVVFFVKHGSVRIGSYEYDEPSEGNDPRLVRLGEVPAIAFSEAMGDLGKIAAKSAAQDAE